MALKGWDNGLPDPIIEKWSHELSPKVMVVFRLKVVDHRKSFMTVTRN